VQFTFELLVDEVSVHSEELFSQSTDKQLTDNSSIFCEYFLYFCQASLIVVCDFLLHELSLIFHLVFAVFESADVLVEEGSGLLLLLHNHCAVIDDHRSLVIVDDHRRVTIILTHLPQHLFLSVVVALLAALSVVVYDGLSAEPRSIEHVHNIIL
jgi:hypothetical protein